VTRASWLSGIAAVALALVAGCGGSSEEPNPVEAARGDAGDAGGWQLAQHDLDAVVLGIWGTGEASAPEVFFVGGTFGATGGQGRILHLAKGAWSWVDAAGAPTLWWAWGSSARDVWAVGEAGTIVHWDGAAWTRVDGDHAYTLWGVWGSSPTDLWAVGGSVGPGEKAVLLHGDGATWARVDAGLTKTESFFKVWGSAADDVYVVGTGGTIAHWDGAAWSAQASGVTDQLTTVSGRSAHEIYAVGGLGAPVLLRSDGARWSRVPGAAGWRGLNGVWAAGEGDVLAAGYDGLLVRGRGDAFAAEAVPTKESFHVVWSAPGLPVFLGGGNLLRENGNEPRGVIVTNAAVAGPIADAGIDAAIDGDAGVDASVDADAAPDADASGDEDAVADVSLDVSLDGDAADDVASDAPPDADADAPEAAVDAPPDVPSDAPGAAEACDSIEQVCAPGLACWLFWYDSRWVCTKGCEDATECEADFGAGACCVPAGPQTFVTTCAPKGYAKCP
jgi:hypothetical protein